MSEVYNFKPLSEVEAQEVPTDATTVLAIENGAVKQIPAGKFGGGGAGNFIVNVVPNFEDGSASGDKTFAEMVAAIEGGALPVAAIDFSMLAAGVVYVMIGAYISENAITFATNMGGGSIMVMCGPDDTWMVQMPG